MTDQQLGPITSRDLWTFAEGIVERFNEAAPSEITDEARLLYALARDHLRMATPPSPTDETIPCSQAGCDKPATQPVLTNYGHLGDLCDDHYAELKAGLE